MNFADLVTEKVIHLGRKNLRDEDLDVLADVLRKSKVLETLNLGDDQLTLADGKFTDALANNRTLTDLWLHENKIGDDGAKRLADALKVNNTLKYLYLTGNQIGDEGAKHIADALMENETLEEIRLGKNEIGDDGAKHIADALMENESLVDISLGWNKIGDDGADSLANCFMVNQSIHEVLLWGNNISDIGGRKLIEALKWNYGIKDLFVGGEPMSEHVEAEIYDLLEDPKRKVPHAQMKHVREKVAMLKAALATEKRRIEIMTTAIRSPLEQLRNIIDPVDLTGDENELSNKRPRMESTVKSNLAIVHQQNQQHTQTLVRVKQEKNAAETNLKSVQEEKEAAETSLNDTREDLEDANETVQQQLLATDIWQRRFDELAALVAGQVD